MDRNNALREARLATRSRRVAGEPLSRQELAEEVNAWIAENAHIRARGALDASYIARLERGAVRWPSEDYRAGFRAVLKAATDAELGFTPRRTSKEALPQVSVPPPQTEVHSTDVTAIKAMSQAFQVADRKVGGGQLYEQVVRYLNTEIAPRLIDPARGSTGSALFSAAASLTEIAGWMAHDSGDDTKARPHFDRAFRLATAADNSALSANVCASMAHLAGQLTQPRDAVRIAEAGLERAHTTASSPVLTARLHALRARALADTADARECQMALQKAENALNNVEEDAPAEWIAPFDRGSLASETALSLQCLGDLVSAEKHARDVIHLRKGDRVRSRAFGQLTLANILVDAGRIDEAAATGAAVCTVAPSLTSARVRRQLSALGTRLGVYGSVTEVSHFLARLSTLHDNTAPTEEPWPV